MFLDRSVSFSHALPESLHHSYTLLVSEVVVWTRTVLCEMELEESFRTSYYVITHDILSHSRACIHCANHCLTGSETAKHPEIWSPTYTSNECPMET